MTYSAPMIKLSLTTRGDKKMLTFNLRNYQKSDLKDIVALFNATVQAVNKKDYSDQQIKQWIQPAPDYEQWNKVLSSTHAVVAHDRNKILGFGSVSATGEIDYLYVDKEWIGYGIGKAIAADLIDYAITTGVKNVTVHSSITAKPFFESLGFEVVEQRSNYRNGVLLLNYLMSLEVAKTTSFPF